VISDKGQTHSRVGNDPRKNTLHYTNSIQQWDVKDCPSSEHDTPANREALVLELNLGFIADQEFSPAIPVRVSMGFYVFYWLLAG
jgi:hypothetical protein